MCVPPLKDGGRFALCHRPERLAEVLAVLRANRLEPKRLAFVKNKADGAPWLFLVEAQKNRKNRPAGGAGCVDQRRCGVIWDADQLRGSYMAGTLYIVATPIGNLDDMPPRVAATFGAADFIAAEDTRVTMKLLNFLGLKKPMVSYYEHALQKGEGILRRIEAGESCALCSDAGMPCVSDPGEVIVRDALARGIKVVPVPAASACVTALAVSGQDTSRWVFEGFLPVNRKQKKRAAG